MPRDHIKKGPLPPSQEHIDKLERVLHEGNPYSAQQMYKSISARYVNAERYDEALDILESGACAQLQHGQVTCGTELALLFVNVLVKGNIPRDDAALARVKKIYSKFPRISLPHHLGEDDDVQRLSESFSAAKLRVEDCSSFLKAAIRWSLVKCGGHKYGSPQLHEMLAEYMYTQSLELDMSKVSFHFVRGDNLKKFASVLVNFMGKCYPGEDDVTVARAVLMYLSLGDLGRATSLLDEVKKQLKAEQLEFPQSQLVQFLSYLLQTLERDALPLLNILRGKYQSSIERDPAFNDLLNDIAEKFYGVKCTNPLQEMFKMMGAGP